MIIFDRLQISDDGKSFYISAHVNKASTFADTTISGLYICLGSQIYETQTIDPESNGYIYSKEYEDVTEINEVIKIGDEDLNYNKTLFKDLFFVYVKCNNVPDNSSCYTAVGNYVLGVTFDTGVFYQKVMQYTRELNKDCFIPKGFVDLILLWNGFNAAIETEHFIVAIDFWNKLFKDGYRLSAATNTCGCNG